MTPTHTLLILDPGHFHAALVLREAHPRLADDIHIYAEPGPDPDLFRKVNARKVTPNCELDSAAFDRLKP